MNGCLASRWCGMALIAVCLGLSAAAAQDEPIAHGPTVDQAKAVFDHRFAEYKDALRKVEQLRTDYQTSDPSAREKINQQLPDTLAAARVRLDAMVAAAIDVYRAAPNSDPQIAELLVAVAKYYAVGQAGPGENSTVNGGDSYEKALPIVKLLLEGGAEERQLEKQLPIWGFVSAFFTNDYDLAEAYLKQATESRAFVDPQSLKDPAERDVMEKALQYAAAIDTYRDLWAKEQVIRAAEAKSDDLPRVKLSTTKGDIVLELFENEAPQAVANFITLVKKGYYDGLAFHRVLHAFMAQGGDPRGDGSGGPGYSIRCECYQPNYRHHFRGSLSMAHSGRDTGGSQFFLTFVPTSHLDGKHTVFGRVIDGMDVLGELQKRDPQGQPPPPDRIIKAEVLRDRGHEYTFEKLPAR